MPCGPGRRLHHRARRRGYGPRRAASRRHRRVPRRPRVGDGRPRPGTDRPGERDGRRAELPALTRAARPGSPTTAPADARRWHAGAAWPRRRRGCLPARVDLRRDDRDVQPSLRVRHARRRASTAAAATPGRGARCRCRCASPAGVTGDLGRRRRAGRARHGAARLHDGQRAQGRGAVELDVALGHARSGPAPATRCRRRRGVVVVGDLPGRGPALDRPGRQPDAGRRRQGLAHLGPAGGRPAADVLGPVAAARRELRDVRAAPRPLPRRQPLGERLGVFVIGARGDMFTRLYDFDISGHDPVFFTYSYEDQRGKGDGAPIQLPAEPWKQQPKIPGVITDGDLDPQGRASTRSTASCASRASRRARPATGSATSPQPAAAGWAFHPTGAPLHGRRLANAPGDTSAVDLGAERGRAVRDAARASRRSSTTSTSTARPRACASARAVSERELLLHHVDGLRQQVRGRGLDDMPRAQYGAIEDAEGTFETARCEATRVGGPPRGARLALRAGRRTARQPTRRAAVRRAAAAASRGRGIGAAAARRDAPRSCRAACPSPTIADARARGAGASRAAAGVTAVFRARPRRARRHDGAGPRRPGRERRVDRSCRAAGVPCPPDRSAAGS